VNFPATLYQHPLAHRASPWPLAGRLVRRRAETAWRSDARVRSDALEKMTFLVGASPRAAEAPRLAKEHVLAGYLRRELLWRPWLTTRQQVDGIDRLRSMLGRGALLSFLHHGQYDAIFASINRYGIPLWVVTNGAPEGRGALRQHANVAYAGARAVANRGTFSRLCELLRQGQLVAVAADVPGGVAAPLLGRVWTVHAGVARLAMETRAPVIPVLVEPAESIQRIRFGEPVHPEGFADTAQLLAAVLRAHEPAVLAWPEAMGTWVLGQMVLRAAPTSAEPAVPGPRAATPAEVTVATPVPSRSWMTISPRE
jgi:lauroyl/myristoyl acyltransferase